MEAVTRLVEADVAVAIGHTDVSYQGACAAFGAGATILTHAFNGMNGIHDRAPGPVLAAIRCAGITLEVINDGVQVDPEWSPSPVMRRPGAWRSSRTRWPPHARPTGDTCSEHFASWCVTGLPGSPLATRLPVQR
jgi:hypothetical protein